jgi:hypothetical protein
LRKRHTDHTYRHSPLLSHEPAFSVTRG